MANRILSYLHLRPKGQVIQTGSVSSTSGEVEASEAGYQRETGTAHRFFSETESSKGMPSGAKR